MSFCFMRISSYLPRICVFVPLWSGFVIYSRSNHRIIEQPAKRFINFIKIFLKFDKFIYNQGGSSGQAVHSRPGKGARELCIFDY